MQSVLKQVQASTSLSERFRGIRENYIAMADRVANGQDSWEHGDPYEIADWSMIHTPIEAAVWSDLRSMRVNMWPQFPVSRYFVDFACPVKRRAIECDGARYHNAEKDAKRDAEMLELGWLVMRIPGWQCFNEDLHKELRIFLGVKA